MRRSVFATLLILATALPLVISGSLLHGYAQATGPQGDEFNYPGFTAPFVVKCATYAAQPCPDAQSSTTWSIDQASPGNLRIWTAFGSLLGTASQASNNARNLVLQPISPYIGGWTITTKLTFPAATVTNTPLGQTAGLMVYQDDDNFIFIGRTFTLSNGQPELEFVQEVGGVDSISTLPETLNPLAGNTVYLRIVNSGNTYFGYYSYDNVTFTQMPAGVPPATVTPTATGSPTATATGTPAPTATATATVLPSSYVASYSAPQVGLFAWGGVNAAVTANEFPADFDWFRVGANSQTPGPTVVATSTATATGTATVTSTPAPTSTPITPTATSTPLPTATSTPSPTSTPTSTPIPTPTPKPVKKAFTPAFRYVSVWYHVVRRGTFEHLEIQANKRTTFGIWVHVIFPSGVHYDFFQNTDNVGHWSISFNVPRTALSRYFNQAIVALQLWHGKRTVKDFEFFTII